MNDAESAMILGKIDFTVITIYMLGVAFLGYIAKRMVKTPEDYFAGGKRVPWWIAAVSHHVSGYSAVLFVAHASQAYEWGLPMALLVFSTPLAMAIGSVLWAPRWSRLKILTPVEYLERRFNVGIRQVFAWSGMAVKFVDEGIKLYSLSMIVSFCTGWQLEWVIVACGVVAVAYLAFGGLWATMLTDFMQFFVQYSITIAMIPFVLAMAGGWSGIWEVQPERFVPFGGRITPAFLLVWLVVITLSYNGGTWGLAQRFYSIGKPREATKAALLSGSLSLVYPFVVFIPA
jgi:solute:Na+ symporter, SSS family